MWRFRAALLVLGVFAPAVVFAQASIAGVVKDTSGAILPGVTVEAASPALIERTRTVVTDSTGQYKIVDLRPGTYSVTFSLTGFSSVKREGIELTGSFSAPVNAEMKVGTVEETITVTGEAPMVDVQGVKQQRVVGREMVDALPTGRMVNSLAVLIPGVTSNITEVGGSNFGALSPQLSIHGGRAGDGRFLIDGLSPANTDGTGQYSGSLPNMTSAQEVTLDTSAASAESSGGGIVINLVPRDGGDTFRGTFFGAGAGRALQSSNYTDELKARGLAAPSELIDTFDINPGFGGPIRRGRVWFFSAARWDGARNYIAGIVGNKNAGNPNAWTYVADPSILPENGSYFHSYNTRLTFQVTPKNKLSLYYDDQTRCSCPNGGANTSVESIVKDYGFPMNRFVTATWTSPITSKMLLEAGIANKGEAWHSARLSDFDPTLIRVTEQSTNITYRGGPATTSGYFTSTDNLRVALSYVTGAHAAKFGATDVWATRDFYTVGIPLPISYRFNNGIPNQITEASTPYHTIGKIKHDFGVYAQDRWTMRRLTLNLGLRFDTLATQFPDQSLTPSVLTPNRNLTFPAQDFVNWKDITPRIGGAYDVFGNGKTAIKATLNRYILASALQGVFGDSPNPVNRQTTSVTRSWNDLFYPVGDPRRGNFVPDCDLTAVAANAECGAMSSNTFGQVVPASTTYDPAVYAGWGVRPANWEFSATVQQQVLPRVSIDIGFFRRWYEHFIVTDNLALAASDFTAFSIKAPVDSRLPGGGGYVISGLYDVNPAKFGQTQNYVTSASNYGDTFEHWNGIDVNFRIRPTGGLNFQGGFSTGHTTVKNCDVHNQLPEQGAGSGGTGLGALNTTIYGIYCDQSLPWLTQVKAIGIYTIPKVDVQLSGTFQSLPGPSVSASYAATNADVQPSLGRVLSGGNTTTTVPLIAPGVLYGDRLNQIDFRFGKVLKFRGTRSVVSVDLYNAMNRNPVLTENATFGPAWRTPQSVLNPRYARISLQVDF